MSENKTHLYRVEVEWEAEKRGRLKAEGFPTISVATPPEFSGHPGIWTPEHLYVASAAICLMSTFLAISQYSRFEFIGFRCEAQGKLESVEGSAIITEIILRPTITVATEALRKRALQIISKAEENCLIARSMKTEIKMEPEILIEKR